MIATAQISSNLIELARLTFALQQLTAKGCDDSLEADSLRDQMEGPWYRLSEPEAELASGLSADLYSLSGEEMPPLDLSEKVVLEDKLKHAWDSHDWATVLTLVRYRPAFLTPDLIAYMRGRCWLELGLPEIALAFFELASNLAPQNVDYRIIAAHIAAKIGDGEKTEQLIRSIDEIVPMANPLQRLRIGGALFALGDSLSEQRAIEVEKKVVLLIEETLLKRDSLQTVSANEAARYWLILGICHLDLDNPQGAGAALQKVLQLQPWNRQARLLLDQHLSSTSFNSLQASQPTRKNLRGSGFLSNGPFERIEPDPVSAIGELVPWVSS